MSCTDGASLRLAYVNEATWGQTPASPSMKELRKLAGSGLVLERDAAQSAEISLDRQRKCFRFGEQKITGTLDGELAYGIYDDLIEAGLMGTWASNVLKAGADRHSFTIEQSYTSISGKYEVFTGVMVDQVDFEFQTGEMAKVSFSLLGRGITVNASELGAPAAAATTCAYSPAEITIYDGATVLEAASAKITVANNLEASYKLGSNDAACVVPGMADITGEVVVAFKDYTLFEKFTGETPVALKVVLDGANGDYEFMLPNCKFTSAEKPAPDTGPIVLTLQFTALYNATEGTALKITRIP